MKQQRVYRFHRSRVQHLLLDQHGQDTKQHLQRDLRGRFGKGHILAHLPDFFFGHRPVLS